MLRRYTWEKVKDKYVPLYLAVEYEKPIDKLASILQANVKASQAALSNLDSILESIFDTATHTKKSEFDYQIIDVNRFLLLKKL